MSSPTNGNDRGRLQPFLSPFYILSTIIAVVVSIGLCALVVRGYLRRRSYQRRFLELVRSGHVVPVFELRDNEAPTASDDPETRARLVYSGVIAEPSMNDVLVQRPIIKEQWQDTQPLGLVSIPPPPTSTRTWLKLLSPPTFFGGPRRLTDAITRTPRLISAEEAANDPAMTEQSSSLPLQQSTTTTKEMKPGLDTLQAMYVIAMPSASAPQFHRRISSASTSTQKQTIEDTQSPLKQTVADLDICLGIHSELWDRSACSSIPVAQPQPPPPPPPQSIRSASVAPSMVPGMMSQPSLVVTQYDYEYDAERSTIGDDRHRGMMRSRSTLGMTPQHSAFGLNSAMQSRSVINSGGGSLAPSRYPSTINFNVVR